MYQFTNYVRSFFVSKVFCSARDGKGLKKKKKGKKGGWESHRESGVELWFNNLAV